MVRKSLVLLLAAILTVSVLQVPLGTAGKAEVEVTVAPVSFAFPGLTYEGEQGFYFNGTSYVPLAFIHKGTTYVPLRFVAEALGKQITWEAQKATVHIRDGEPPKLPAKGDGELPPAEWGKTLVLQPPYAQIRLNIHGTERQGPVAQGIYVNGKNEVPLTLNYQGTLYMPVRYIAESFDKKVEWDQKTQTISISGDGPAQNKEQELTIYWDYSQPYDLRMDSIEPIVAFNDFRIFVLNHVMEGLMRLDRDGHPVPGMAEQVQVSDDGLIYTFHIREAKWSDDSPVTAQDFVYAWKDVLKRGDMNYLLKRVEGVEEYREKRAERDDKILQGEDLPLIEPENVGLHALDSNTLQVTLAKPDPGFLTLVAHPAFFPVQKEYAEREGYDFGMKGKLLFNGPFMINFINAGSIYLEKNPQYWNSDQVRLERINVAISNQVEFDIKKYDSQYYDFVMIDNDKDIQTVKDHAGHMTADRPMFYYALFNNQSTLFSNKKLRQAAALLIDRKMIGINDVSREAEGIITRDLSGEENEFRFEHEIILVERNVEKAKALIVEAKREMGVDQLPKVQFVVWDYPEKRYKNMVEQIVSDLRQGGFIVEVLPVHPYASSRMYKEGTYDLGLQGWIYDYDNPLNFLETLSSFHPENSTFHQNEWYDEMLEQADKTNDLAERTQLIADMEKYLVDDAVIVPLYTKPRHFLQQNDVKGVIHETFASPFDFTHAYLSGNDR